jgi:hypothetical protein
VFFVEPAKGEVVSWQATHLLLAWESRISAVKAARPVPVPTLAPLPASPNPWVMTIAPEPRPGLDIFAVYEF